MFSCGQGSFPEAGMTSNNNKIPNDCFIVSSHEQSRVNENRFRVVSQKGFVIPTQHLDNSLVYIIKTAEAGSFMKKKIAVMETHRGFVEHFFVFLKFKSFDMVQPLR